MVLCPEHPLIKKITAPEQSQLVDEYVYKAINQNVNRFKKTKITVVIHNV